MQPPPTALRVFKLKSELWYDLASPLLGMCPEETNLKRYTHPVDCSTVNSSQDKEMTVKSTRRQVDKDDVVHTTHGTLRAQSLQVHLTLQPHGLQPTRLFRPWDSPGKNTGVGCRFLLQGTFPTQGLNLHWHSTVEQYSTIKRMK